MDNNLESFFLQNGHCEDIMTQRKEILNCPRVPKPLHGVAPRLIWGQKQWDLVRRERYAEFGLCCWACGVNKNSEGILWKNQLHAHEVYDIDYENCVMRLKEVVALCECCHAFIHDGRSNSLFDKGEYDEETMFLIINRGLQVLGRPKGRHPLDNDDYYIKTWDKWYLELDGKKYYSKFKNIEEWNKFYNAGKEQ